MCSAHFTPPQNRDPPAHTPPHSPPVLTPRARAVPSLTVHGRLSRHNVPARHAPGRPAVNLSPASRSRPRRGRGGGRRRGGTSACGTGRHRTVSALAAQNPLALNPISHADFSAMLDHANIDEAMLDMHAVYVTTFSRGAQFHESSLRPHR